MSSNHLIDPGYFKGFNYPNTAQKLGIGNSGGDVANGYGICNATTGTGNISGGCVFSHLHVGDVIQYYAGTGISGSATILSFTGSHYMSFLDVFDATTDVIFPDAHDLLITLPTADIIVQKSGYVTGVIGQNISYYYMHNIFTLGDVVLYINPDESTGSFTVNTAVLVLVQNGLSVYELNTPDDVSSLQGGAVIYIPGNSGGGGGLSRVTAQLLAKRNGLRLSK